jgi:hypothetical protein
MRLGIHAQPTTLMLAFDAPLDPARAQDPSNYRIVDPRGRPVGLAWARYNAAAWAVLLRPSARLNVHHPYRLTVVGTAPSGVADTSGRLLDGAGTGRPGSDFTTVVDLSSLVLPGRFPRGPGIARFARSVRAPVGA